MGAGVKYKHPFHGMLTSAVLCGVALLAVYAAPALASEELRITFPENGSVVDVGRIEPAMSVVKGLGFPLDQQSVEGCVQLDELVRILALFSSFSLLFILNSMFYSRYAVIKSAICRKTT